MAVHWRVYPYAYRSQYQERYDTGESQPDAPAAPVRLLLVFGGADGDHEVVFADRPLHELRELVTGHRVPAVERHVDAALGPQPGCELLDPIGMRVVVPGV